LASDAESDVVSTLLSTPDFAHEISSRAATAMLMERLVRHMAISLFKRRARLPAYPSDAARPKIL
jgi:hypothetical protein